MVRVIQISDTHLSPTKRHFAANWAPVAAWLAGEKPDLVIHTGDVTVDAADHEGDAAHCARLLEDLGIPVLSVPGNHDVGDARDPHQPVNRGRLERWRRHFGPDRWIRDVEGWRLIGLNSLLLGSGEPEEMEQSEWLRQAMAEAGGRRLAWFKHRPLFIGDPGEGDTGYWSVKPAPRGALLGLLREYRVEIVSSGHLHRWHDMSLDGTRYIWSPATGFLVGDGMHPPMGGCARLGAVIHEIDGDDLSITLTPIDSLQTYWIDDVVHEVYPPRDAGA